MAGAFRSTRLPATGPAVTQLPFTSQTLRVSVAAFGSSVPGATLVLSEKLAPGDATSPEPESLAVQAMVTLFECHRPSAVPQTTVGDVVSTTVAVNELVAVLWAASEAVQVIRCGPRARVVPDAGAQLTATMAST